jgi:hypothetical protein
VLDEIRADAPNTIVILTADNGAWLDAYPDAGTTRSAARRARPLKVVGACRHHVVAGTHSRRARTYGEMMSHIDCWSTLAGMAGITPPPYGEMKDNNGKPIYFDSIDNSAYILGKAQHSARTSWIYINGEYLNAVRADVGGDPNEPWLNIAWKFMWTAKESWLGPTMNLGSCPRALQPHHGSRTRSTT